MGKLIVTGIQRSGYDRQWRHKWSAILSLTQLSTITNHCVNLVVFWETGSPFARLTKINALNLNSARLRDDQSSTLQIFAYE